MLYSSGGDVSSLLSGDERGLSGICTGKAAISPELFKKRCRQEGDATKDREKYRKDPSGGAQDEKERGTPLEGRSGKE